MFLTARGFDWWSRVEYTARKAKRILTLLRRFCYTWKTPVKIQIIKTFVLPIIQYAAPLMVAGSSKLLANPSINECLEHAQELRKGYLASQWSLLDDVVSIAYLFILGIEVYPSVGMAVTAIELASTRAVELTVQSIVLQLPLMAEANPVRLQLSSMRRWLSRAHGVTSRLPTFGDTPLSTITKRL